MILAQNAEPILQARLKGFKPADLVIVSLVGPVGRDNPTVFADVSKEYDWRWCKGLDVCVYLDDTLDWPAIVKAITLARPAHIDLWNHADKWGAQVFLKPTAQDIEKPPRRWQFELDFLIWMDFQNQDFINCTTYERDQNGIPYAVSH